MNFPAQFGDYLLLKKLATGGMAETFLARRSDDETCGNEFVIKRLLPQWSEDPEFINRFKQEAEVGAGLVHDNIAQVFHCGDADGEPFIAMEYIWGEDLRRIAERGMTSGRFLTIEQAVMVCAEVAGALAAVHDAKTELGGNRGLVHRDVSPPNIMVGFDGHVRLVDFGIALSDGPTNVRQGQLQGKFGYMSPEQVEGLGVDHRSDLFSLGTVLYEFTTKKRLFKGANDIATMKLVAEADVQPPSSALRSYPADLEEIVLKALAKDRDRRYSSAAEMRRDLAGFLDSRTDYNGHEDLAKYMTGLFPDSLEEIEGVTEAGYGGPSRSAEELAKPLEKEEAAEVPLLDESPPPPPAAPPLEIPKLVETPDPEQDPLDLTDVVEEEPAAAVTAVSHTLRKVRRDKFENAAESSRQFVVWIAIICVLVSGALVWYGRNYDWPWENWGPREEAPDVPPLPPRELPTTVSMAVESQPEGAAVAVNGVIAPGLTPTSVEVVPYVTNTLVFYLDGYETQLTDHAVADEAPESLSLVLVPIAVPEEWTPPPLPPESTEVPDQFPMGQLQITTDPAGSTIFRNGVEECTAPCRLDVPADQEQHITARRHGHLDTVSQTTAMPFVEERDTRFLQLELRPNPDRHRIYTFFNLDSYPEYSVIRLNGEEVAVTPAAFQRELTELYRVELTHDDFVPWSRSFYPSVGRFELRPILERVNREPAMLSVSVDSIETPGTRIYVGRPGGAATREVGQDAVQDLVLDSGEYQLTLSYTPPRDSGESRRRTRLDIELPGGTHVVERYAWNGVDFALVERVATEVDLTEED